MAVGGVHAVAVQLVEDEVKQVPEAPTGNTVILTLSPPVKPFTEYDNTLPIVPTLNNGPEFIW